MKTIFRISILIFMSVLFFNCSSDDDNSSNSTTEFSPELLNGTWVISFFSDEVEDRTAEFNGYEITFNVEEETGTVTYNGAFQTSFIEIFQEVINGEAIWVVYTDFDDTEILGDADFSDLIEYWFVTKVNANATVIEFEELYSNNAPEILHLTKVSNGS